MSRGQKEDARRVRFKRPAAHEEVLEILKDILRGTRGRVRMGGGWRRGDGHARASFEGAKVRGCGCVLKSVMMLMRPVCFSLGGRTSPCAN